MFCRQGRPEHQKFYSLILLVRKIRIPVNLNAPPNASDRCRCLAPPRAERAELAQLATAFLRSVAEPHRAFLKAEGPPPLWKGHEWCGRNPSQLSRVQPAACFFACSGIPALPLRPSGDFEMVRWRGGVEALASSFSQPASQPAVFLASGRWAASPTPPGSARSWDPLDVPVGGAGGSHLPARAPLTPAISRVPPFFRYPFKNGP